MPLTDPPPLRPFAHLEVVVGPSIDLGAVGGVHRRIIPITGGTAEGGLVGRVLPGGADDQVVASVTRTELDARYAIETEDGERVTVRNRAVRVAPAEATAAIARGERVDPAAVYFRGAVRLESDAPRLRWLADRLLLAVGARAPHAVTIDLFLVD